MELNHDNIAVSESDIHNIVLSYLVHNCFKETAESFVSSTRINRPADHLEDIDRRKKIMKYSVEGNALEAIELTEQLAPGLLKENQDLHFDVLSLHFIELVCAKRCTEALEFAQKKLTPFGMEQKYFIELKNFMSLLAYEEPEKSPMFHFLSLDYRQYVADKLNQAVLAHTMRPSYSSLERLIQQSAVVGQQLNQERSKQSVDDEDGTGGSSSTQLPPDFTRRFTRMESQVADIHLIMMSMHQWHVSQGHWEDRLNSRVPTPDHVEENNDVEDECIQLTPDFSEQFTRIEGHVANMHTMMMSTSVARFARPLRGSIQFFGANTWLPRRG